MVEITYTLRFENKMGHFLANTLFLLLEELGQMAAFSGCEGVSVSTDVYEVLDTSKPEVTQ